MLERAQRGLIPIGRFQDCAKHGLEPAILVTRQRHCPSQQIHAADFREILAAEVVDSLSGGLIQARRLDDAPHELVMVHFLSLLGNARIRRQIVCVAFSLAQRDQVLI